MVQSPKAQVQVQAQAQVQARALAVSRRSASKVLTILDFCRLSTRTSSTPLPQVVCQSGTTFSRMTSLPSSDRMIMSSPGILGLPLQREMRNKRIV